MGLLGDRAQRERKARTSKAWKDWEAAMKRSQSEPWLKDEAERQRREQPKQQELFEKDEQA